MNKHAQTGRPAPPPDKLGCARDLWWHARHVTIVLLLVSTAGVSGGLGADSNSCDDCHSDPGFFARDKTLFHYYQEWLKSQHKSAGLTCDQCHGGDSTAASKALAHRGMLPHSDPESPVSYRNQPTTCSRCHAEVARYFENSRHYKVLNANGNAGPSCATCHPPMVRTPNYLELVQQACMHCHYADNPDKLPLVVDEFSEILHRRVIAKSYLGWMSFHFESQNWPNRSRQRVAELESLYHDVVRGSHDFDLTDADERSADLLARVKSAFDAAWKARQRDK